MIHLRTLGTLELKGGHPLDVRAVLAQPKRLALLVYLALASPRRFHERDSLIALFWPEKDQEHARNALRQSLHTLRRTLGQDLLDNRGDREVGLNWSCFSSDVDQFEQAIEARQSVEALELYRGDLLPGFYIPEPGFEHWLDGMRARLRRLAAREAWQLSDEAAAAGNIGLAVQWARHVAAGSPDDESAVRRLILLLGRAGDRTEVARVFAGFTRRLADDYQMVPGVELEALVAGILAPPNPGSRAAPARRLETMERGRDQDERHRYPETTGPRTRIAVLPFAVGSAARLQYLREGTAELLSTALEGAGGLQTVDRKAIRSFCADTTDPSIQHGKALAHRLGASRFVLGRLEGSGRHLRLMAALYAADGTLRLDLRSESGTEAGVFGLIDDLALRILAAEQGEGSRQLGRSAVETTASLPALKRFLDGERLFGAARWLEATAAFTGALSHDGSMALAYQRLSWTAFWLLQPDQARDCADQALARSARLSPRDRLGLQAFRAFLAGDVATAERLYHDLLNRWPDDVQGYVGLGLMLLMLNPMRGRPAEESQAPLRYARILDPENIDARMMLAYLTARREHYGELESLAAWLRPESDYALIIASNAAVVRRDSGEVARIRGLLEEAPDLLVHECCRYAAVVGHDLAESQRLAGLLTRARRPPEVRATGHILLAQIHLVRGRLRASREEFDTAVSFAPVQSGVYHALAAALPLFQWSPAELVALRRQVMAWDVGRQPRGTAPPFLVHGEIYPELQHYLLSLLELRLGDLAAALHHAVQLEHSAGPPQALALAMDLNLSIRAQVSAARGDSAAALALLEQIRIQPAYEGVQMQSPFFSENLERYLRARLLENHGRLDEALHWYDSLCENGLYEFVYLAPCHFRRGIILRRLGQQEEATNHFRQVTELWQYADPELEPLVMEAARAVQAC